MQHKKAVQFLYNRLKDCPHVTTAAWGTTCTSLHLGRAAEILEHPENARRHYADALEVARKIRYRPEIAIIRFQICRLLLKHYPEEREEALEHLNFALQEFEEMQMAPFIKRATALKQRIQ